MNDSTAGPSRDLLSTDEVATRTIATSWDPYEVWLTRVKLPRELAADRLITGVGRAPRKSPE
ncbi:MAG: hypothetical protein K0R70_1297 [Steroidobacteraceae bacterium]|jgi:hypothetical protein|nr:hypothetical protein [Steroidobacteraceae bacterium]